MAVGLLVCIDNGEIVGVVNINKIVRGTYRRAALGYGAFLPYAGHGFMTAGVALAIRYAFDDLGLHRIEADIQPGNTASLSLVKRLGFRREPFASEQIEIDGVWCVHERWALTKAMLEIADS